MQYNYFLNFYITPDNLLDVDSQNGDTGQLIN